MSSFWGQIHSYCITFSQQFSIGPIFRAHNNHNKLVTLQHISVCLGCVLENCHTLTLVFFVFLVILVRSGCDMGDVCVLPCLGVLFVYGAVSFLGVY